MTTKVKQYDVFLSHAWADGALPQQIADALSTAGLHVWFDAQEIEDFEGITRAVTEGIASSKLLLAYYSRTYPRRRACQWELTAAFIAGQAEGNSRARILVVNPETTTDHIDPIELRDEKHPTTAKNPDEMQALVKAITNRVAKFGQPIGSIRPFTSSKWYGLTPIGSTRFVGRIPEMWRVHSLLRSGDVAQITGAVGAQGSIGLVQGLGGIGKSLLAEEYAMRFAAAYPGGIFWLKGYGNEETSSSLRPQDIETLRVDQLRYFVRAVGQDPSGMLSEDLRYVLGEKIHSGGLPCLWIVDDLPAGLSADRVRQWFAPHQLARTLVTTRSRSYSAIAAAINLDVLHPEDSYQLLTWQRRPVGEQEQTEARRLASELGHHALALDVTGSALVHFGGGQPFREFRDQLAQEDQDALELAKELADILPNGHERSIAQTLLRSITRLGAEGRDFLRLASVLATDPISASLVTAVFETANNERHIEAQQYQARAFYQVTEATLAEITGERQEARTVHTLVSRTVRFLDSGLVRTGVLRAAAIGPLLAVIASGVENPATQDAIQSLVAHARQILSKATTLPEANLLGFVAAYDQTRGDYSSAQRLFSREVEIRCKTQGEFNPDTLNARLSLASVMWNLGHFSEARSLQEEALSVVESTRASEDLLVTALGNLGLTLADQGDLEKAQKLTERALALSSQSKALGPEHRKTLAAMAALAQILELQKCLPGALALSEQTLALYRKVFGNEDGGTLSAMNNRAHVLNAQADVCANENNLDRARALRMEARALYEQTLNIRTAKRGREHPDTLTSINNLAYVLWKSGDLQGARGLEQEAYSLRRRRYGTENPSTSLGAWNLLNTLLEMNEFESAKTLFQTDLQWLLNKDAATLGSDQRGVRERLLELIKRTKLGS